MGQLYCHAYSLFTIPYWPSLKSAQRPAINTQYRTVGRYTQYRTVRSTVQYAVPYGR